MAFQASGKEIEDFTMSKIADDPDYSRQFSGRIGTMKVTGKLVKREPDFKGKPGRSGQLTILGEEECVQNVVVYINKDDPNRATVF